MNLVVCKVQSVSVQWKRCDWDNDLVPPLRVTVTVRSLKLSELSRILTSRRSDSRSLNVRLSITF